MSWILGASEAEKACTWDAGLAGCSVLASEGAAVQGEPVRGVHAVAARGPG